MVLEPLFHVHPTPGPSPGTKHLHPAARPWHSELCWHPQSNWNPSPAAEFGPCLTILQHSAVSVHPASTCLPRSRSLLTRTGTWLCSGTHRHHSMASPRERQCLDPAGITCPSCPRQEDDDPCGSPQHLRVGDYLHNTNSSGTRLLSCPKARSGRS